MSRFGAFTTFALTMVLVCLVLPALPAPADQGGVAHVPDEVIIKFKANANQIEKDQIRAELGGVKIKGFGRIKAEQRRLGSMTVDEAIARYRNHPKVEYIEPNFIIYADGTPNDPRFTELWGMENTGQTGGTPGADISATNAWDVFTGSDQVLIGVIDTGVDYNHPDLAGNIWTNPGEIPGNSIDDDGNGYVDDVHGYDFINNDGDPMDDNGHGSHCSGTIGGVGNNGIGVAGVNWDVSIMGLKFLSSSGSGSTADAVEAIEYATMMGVRLTSNSWGGGGYSQAMFDAISAANDAGVLFVAAAGNSSSNTDVSPHYPSSYNLPNVIAVAATDHNDQLASFSSYGATTVDLAAPGVDILSTLPGNSYGLNSGTSMATPHVSGVCGLVFGRFPAIGHLDAKSLILNFADPLPNLTGVVLTGARLNAFFPIADPDSIPPSAVFDLAVTNAGSNWLSLAWSAPGDDDIVGAASRYDMRYSLAPITDANFDLATAVDGEPDPGPYGTPEAMTVYGLDFDTTYFFAVKARDEFGNAGNASNSPSGTTLGIPDIAWTPTSLAETLLTGASSNQTITLSNVGLGTLDFTVGLPDLVTTAPVQAEAVQYAKGEVDPRPGILGAGGPDAFGYRYVDSDEPFGPAYVWNDISGVGSVAIASGDDTNAGPFSLGFDFSFYGVTYNSFRVCSNGWLSFTSTATAYSNQPLPSAGAPSNLVAPFWDDLNVASGGTVYYHNDGARMIVQWDAVPHYGTGGPYTFQAVLYPDGMVEFLYESMGSPDNSATVGIQNAGGSDGLQVAYNTLYVHDGLAVRIQAVPQWATVAPNAGTIYAPNSTDLTVTFDASGLLGGTYEGFVRVASNDPDEPLVSVPLTLTVIGAPDIDVAPLAFDFGPVFLGATPTTDILVQNPGTDSLHVSSVSIAGAGFSADPSGFVVPPKGSHAVEVTFAPVAAQPYSATLSVFSDDPDAPQVDVALSGEGVTPPDFAVTPSELNAALLTGQSETQQLTISNSGGADLEYDVSLDLGVQVTVYDMPDLAKGEVDNNAGILGAGGPDTYGYSWIDSDEPGGPVFDWTDISTTGTSVFSGTADDVNVGPFPIGFTFPFYGTSFTEFRISSNGFISFTSTASDLSNAPLPGTGAPENLLAMFHDDLRIDTSTGANVYYQYDGTKLIVQFDQVPKYFTSGALTFQAHLYPNGTIFYYYLSMVDAALNSATIGIQNATRDDGLTVVYNSSYVHDGLAIRFGSSPDWLTASPTSGVVPPGGSEVIDVTFNAADLFGGFYEGQVIIDTNDPIAPQVVVPANLTVTGAPDIDVSPLALDFGEVFIGYPDQLPFTIVNTGTDNLVISGFGSDNPRFAVSLAGVSLPITLTPLQSTSLQAVFSPNVSGPTSGNLSVANNDPDENPVLIAVTGSGRVAPVASVAPNSLHADLLTGEQEAQSFTLYNTGGSDLDFEVQALSALADVTVYDMPDLAKGEVDNNVGILGSGGPDNFGYSWTDSDEPDGPVFDWTDISGLGTPVYSGNADDSNQGPFPIGFDFSFYGNTFSTFRVSSNGFISFTSTSSDLSNSALPGTGSPENLLAVLHDDMYVDADIPSQVFYYNDGGRLIVQFDQIRRYGQSDNSPPFYTFQAILYPNGTIVYQYLTVETGGNSGCTIGIQNDARDDGLTVVYNSSYVHDGLAIRLATSPDWLSASPATGTIPPGGSLPINVLFNANGLFGGDYAGAVRVLNNDPANGAIDVATTLHVTGVPRIGFDPASVDFGDVYVGFPEALDLTVTNVGTDLLSVTGILAGNGDYSVAPTAFDLDPLMSTTVTVTFGPSAAGINASDLTFMSNDPDSPHTVPVSGNGVMPPIMVIDPTFMEEAAMPGMGPVTRTMTVCNTGGSDLEFTVAWGEATATAAQIHAAYEMPKGEDVEGAAQPVDPRPGMLGSGGPDAFGYTWVDSDDPSGPAFDWVDVSGVGTPIVWGGSYHDDSNTGPMPLGFDFSFYGNSFSEFYASTNGWVSFTNTTTDYSNDPLPSAGGPENLLAVFWDDMVYDESDGSSAFYHYDGTRTILQFNNIRRIGNFTAPFYSYEIILYPNGDIVYQYLTLGSTTTSATIGIQNADRDDALMVVYNDAYVHTDLAIKFSSAPGWLSVAPESGIVAPGECAELTVTMDASALEAGDYLGVVTVSGNDPALPSDDMDVLFHVGTIDAVDAMVTPNTLNLDSNGNWISATVELPAGFDPNDVILETVLFDGVVPAVIGPNSGNVSGQSISFKFDREAVQAILEAGDSVLVTITGEIDNTTYFVATDYIRVIRPQVTAPNGGDLIAAEVPYDITWTEPEGYTVDFATIYFSADNGVTWELVADNVIGTTYRWVTPPMDTEEGRIAVFLSDHKGVMGLDTSDTVFTLSGSILDAGSVTPSVYALHQNAPNPFRGATRIRFDLPEEARVELSVYDVTGRVVKVLANDLLPAGVHEASWDGRDATGRDVASGIYFYRVRSDSYTSTKRMFVLQ